MCGNRTGWGFGSFRLQTGISPIFSCCEFRDIGGPWTFPWTE